MKKLLSVLITSVLALGGLTACGNKDITADWKQKPQYGPFDYKAWVSEGINANDEMFNVENTEALESSVLKGKTIYFLGSSVTYGVDGTSFVEYIGKRNDCTVVKDAVSGTKLQNNAKNSYVARMLNSKQFDYDAKINAFVVQLSTNDMYDVSKFGKITGKKVKDLEQFDDKTVAGAIEYIISYVQQTWDCEIFFYSGAYFKTANEDDIANYGKMNDILKDAQRKWGINIIDMFGDEVFNQVPDSALEGNDGSSFDLYKWLMSDYIHPKLAGYKLWWTPYIEGYLCHILSK